MLDAAYDAFSAWVARSPTLAQWVLDDLDFVCSLLDLSETGGLERHGPATLIEMRLALVRLYQVASQAGFGAVAALFYHWYERCCLALLPFWSDSMRGR
jgi:hypothetical protein